MSFVKKYYKASIWGSAYTSRVVFNAGISTTYTVNT